MSRYDSRHFVMSYIIRALEHNSVYEVMVQAKNRYGWNEVRHKKYSKSFFSSQLTCGKTKQARRYKETLSCDMQAIYDVVGQIY